jgi:hypothetical protein
MRLEAICARSVEEATEVSHSLANRRHRPSHANVLSTTHLRGRSLKPLAVSDLLTISRVNLGLTQYVRQIADDVARRRGAP